MYPSRDHLVIFDADGTIIDAFGAVTAAFAEMGMELGDFERFQRRRRLFKYLGGLREFPANLKKQLGRQQRRELLDRVTEIYRDEACLYPGIGDLLHDLLAAPNIRVGLVTRNLTHDPEITLGRLFNRHNIDLGAFDHVAHVGLSEDKAPFFRQARERFGLNPARCCACGDEVKDYLAAFATGFRPFVVSYGLEGYRRLTEKFAIPAELVSQTPEDLCARLRHTMDLT